MPESQKKILVAFAILAALVVLAFVIYSLPTFKNAPEDEITENRNTQDREEEEDSEEVLSIENERIIEETDNFSIVINYPTFDSPASSAVESYVKNRVGNFRSETGEFASQSSVPLTLNIDYETQYVGENFVSFLFTESTYTGGVHPNESPVGKTYEVESGTEISVTNIFVPGSGYLEEFSRRTKEKFRSEFDQGGFFEAGAEPRTINFTSFTIDDKSITFYFGPYQIAPYAAGTQTITIPLSELEDYLRDDFKERII
jgi:hypothetical protein